MQPYFLPNHPIPRTAFTFQPRPAGQGPTCDAWLPTDNPDGPYLRRCRRHATIRLTILTPTDCYDVKRCDLCAEDLRGRVASGATFEILAELEIK